MSEKEKRGFSLLEIIIGGVIVIGGMVLLGRHLNQKLQKLEEDAGTSFLGELKGLIADWLARNKGYNKAELDKMLVEGNGFEGFKSIPEILRIEISLLKRNPDKIDVQLYFVSSEQPNPKVVKINTSYQWIDIPGYYREEFIRTGLKEMKYVLYER